MDNNTAKFRQQYENNKQAMYNFAKKLTRDVNEAEELVQIVTIRAYRGWHTFKEGTSFKSWIFTIIKNSFITKYNKRKRRNIVSLPAEDMQYAADRKYKGENEAISNLKVEAIQNCIDDLSYKIRVPFEMYTEGFQYNEIAETLEIPIGTVKSRINSARKKAKEKLVAANIVAA